MCWRKRMLLDGRTLRLRLLSGSMFLNRILLIAYLNVNAQKNPTYKIFHPSTSRAKISYFILIGLADEPLKNFFVPLIDAASLVWEFKNFLWISKLAVKVLFRGIATFASSREDLKVTSRPWQWVWRESLKASCSPTTWNIDGCVRKQYWNKNDHCRVYLVRIVGEFFGTSLHLT